MSYPELSDKIFHQYEITQKYTSHKWWKMKKINQEYLNRMILQSKMISYQINHINIPESILPPIILRQSLTSVTSDNEIPETC